MILAGGKCGGACAKRPYNSGRVDLMRKALEAWQRETYNCYYQSTVK